MVIAESFVIFAGNFKPLHASSHFAAKPALSNQVRMKKVHGLCGTYQSDKGFFCLTRYIFSDAYPAPSIHARKSSECLDSAYWNVAGDEGSGSLLERWQIDDERVFKWTVRIKIHPQRMLLLHAC